MGLYCRVYHYSPLSPLKSQAQTCLTCKFGFSLVLVAIQVLCLVWSFSAHSSSWGWLAQEKQKVIFMPAQGLCSAGMRNLHGGLTTNQHPMKLILTKLPLWLSKEEKNYMMYSQKYCVFSSLPNWEAVGAYPKGEGWGVAVTVRGDQPQGALPASTRLQHSLRWVGAPGRRLAGSSTLCAIVTDTDTESQLRPASHHPLSLTNSDHYGSDGDMDGVQTTMA